VNEYLSKLGPAAPRKNLREILDSGLIAPASASTIKQAVADHSSPNSDKNCTGDAKLRLAAAAFVEKLMAEQKIDALIFPSANQPAPPLTQVHPPPRGFFASVLVSAFSGLPSVTFPAGTVVAADGHTVPMGLVFLGPRWSEERLLQLAYSFEQTYSMRLPPASTPPLHH
jgi:amidase